MTSRTWFLPPDFTFLPDGQIALGRIIANPGQPTNTIASLSDYPDITLPEVKPIVEKNRSFSTENKRSFGLELLAKFLDIVDTSAKTDLSWYKNKSFSAVDHEIQAYNGPFAPETLQAIVALDEVRKYINGGRFGKRRKRHVYIISGLRVAQQSFTVTNETGKTAATSLSASGPVPAGVVPVELGASVSGGEERKINHGYDTAPGIVFAYRLHVIRPREAGEESELFSDRSAFFSGEAEEREAEELEVVEVDEVVLRHDLDLKVNSYYKDKIGTQESEGSCIIFKNNDGGKVLG